MGKIDYLILKIVLGIFAAANFVACIVTTDFKVLFLVNLLVAGVCFCLFLLMESKVSGLARELGIPRRDTRKLISKYFDYYKNVERISVYEYLERSLAKGNQAND